MRKYQTTGDVEAYYRQHPPDHQGPPVPVWVKVALTAAALVMVVGFVLAFG